MILEMASLFGSIYDILKKYFKWEINGAKVNGPKLIWILLPKFLIWRTQKTEFNSSQKSKDLVVYSNQGLGCFLFLKKKMTFESTRDPPCIFNLELKNLPSSVLFQHIRGYDFVICFVKV